MNNIGGSARPTGSVEHSRVRDLGDLQVRPASRIWNLKNWVQHRRREVPSNVATSFLGRVPGVFTVQSELKGRVYRPNLAALAPWQLDKLRALLQANFNIAELPALFGGQVLDYGVLSRRVVTTAGVNFIVDAFQNLTEVENFKYHGYGTGTNAEATGNTTLQTELTTEYVSNNTRPTGSQGEGASANVYRTTATLSPDSGGTLAITEHGIFDQAANSGGTLLDRSVFSAINLVASSDSLQTQYDLTVSAGG